jgi:hypothetical protein
MWAMVVGIFTCNLWAPPQGIAQSVGIGAQGHNVQLVPFVLGLIAVIGGMVWGGWPGNSIPGRLVFPSRPIRPELLTLRVMAKEVGHSEALALGNTVTQRIKRQPTALLPCRSAAPS